MASANSNAGTGTSSTASNDLDTVRDNALQSMQQMCKKIMSTLVTPLRKEGDPSAGLSCVRLHCIGTCSEHDFTRISQSSGNMWLIHLLANF